MAELQTEQIVQTTKGLVCKHCGKAPTHVKEFYSGGYDYSMTWTCGCVIATKIGHLREELAGMGQLEKQLRSQLEFYLTEEAEDLKQARAKQELEVMMKKFNMGAEEVEELLGRR